MFRYEKIITQDMACAYWLKRTVPHHQPNTLTECRGSVATSESLQVSYYTRAMASGYCVHNGVHWAAAAQAWRKLPDKSPLAASFRSISPCVGIVFIVEMHCRRTVVSSSSYISIW